MNVHECYDRPQSVTIYKDDWWMIGGLPIIYCPYCGLRLPRKRKSRLGMRLRRFTEEEDESIVERMLAALYDDYSAPAALKELAQQLDRSYESVKYRWYIYLNPQVQQHISEV